MISFLYFFMATASLLSIAPQTQLTSLASHPHTPSPYVFFYTYQKDAPCRYYFTSTCYTAKTFCSTQPDRLSWVTYALSENDIKNIPIPSSHTPNLSEKDWKNFVLHAQGYRNERPLFTHMSQLKRRALIKHIRKSPVTPHLIIFHYHEKKFHRPHIPGKRKKGLYFYYDPLKERTYIHRRIHLLNARLSDITSSVHFVSFNQLKTMPDLDNFPSGDHLVNLILTPSRPPWLSTLSPHQKKIFVQHILSTLTVENISFKESEDTSILPQTPPSMNELFPLSMEEKHPTVTDPPFFTDTNIESQPITPPPLPPSFPQKREAPISSSRYHRKRPHPHSLTPEVPLSQRHCQHPQPLPHPIDDIPLKKDLLPAASPPSSHAAITHRLQQHPTKEDLDVAQFMSFSPPS